jgi:hypothetical protein
VIDAAGDRFLTIAVFTDKAGLDQAGTLEADWVAKQAKTLLPTPPATAGGGVILHTASGIGCPCTTGVDNPCGSDQLVCCGDPGVCVSSATGCGEGATCLGPGEHCTDPSQCCQGYTCFEAVCDNPRGCFGPGDPCTASTDCCEGSCSSDGRCYCSDPARPEIGCSCDASDTSACGGRPDLCCEGTCISPMASCSPPAACAEPGQPCTDASQCCQGSCSPDGQCYCTDPSRPEIGCTCDAADANACGGRPELCCSGTCISPMANC